MRSTILYLFILLSAPTSCFAQSIERITYNAKDTLHGYYLAAVPHIQQIDGVLVLLPGFGQRAESIYPESKLFNVAAHNNILVIAVAGGNKLYADETVVNNLTAVFNDVTKRFHVNPEKFAIGGYSAGGAIALRYTELCNQYPGKYPIKPKAVFMVDSPIDIFTIWDQLEETAKANFSDVAVNEANWAMKEIREDHGVPKEHVKEYAAINAFSMNKEYGTNEQYLNNTAVLAYHDVDISWRLVNRRQTVRDANYLVTAELINRLLLMGNNKAEFIQATGKGYRSNGQRHPHSWSIVDEPACISWIKEQWK
jgi:pimeloyl-ACP methyl ester carboxylesterase